MILHLSIALTQLLYLTSQTYAENNNRFLLHLDFGAHRTSTRPTLPVTLSEGFHVLCSEASFPTGTYCDFSRAFRKSSYIPNLNRINELRLYYPHPSRRRSCYLSLSSAGNHTPPRVTFRRSSCTKGVFQYTVPRVKMSDISGMLLKYPKGGLECIVRVTVSRIINLVTKSRKRNPVVGFSSEELGCIAGVAVGRPEVIEVESVEFPDRIRERPVFD